MVEIQDPELVRMLQIKELAERFVADHPIEVLEEQIREALDQDEENQDMACAHCGSDADWYKLEDGRSRCPNCYATTDPKGAEDDMKEQLEQRDSTDKATTTPTRIDDEVAKQVAKDTK